MSEQCSKLLPQTRVVKCTKHTFLISAHFAISAYFLPGLATCMCLISMVKQDRVQCKSNNRGCAIFQSSSPLTCFLLAVTSHDILPQHPRKNQRSLWECGRRSYQTSVGSMIMLNFWLSLHFQYLSHRWCPDIFVHMVPSNDAFDCVFPQSLTSIDRAVKVGGTNGRC